MTEGWAWRPSSEEDAAPPRRPAPAAVQLAVRVMIARVTIGLAGLVILVATRSTVRRSIADANPGYPAARLDSALNAYVAVRIVFGLVFAVLYVLLALQVGRGRNWARVITLVFAALGIAGFVAGLAQPVEIANRVFGAVVVALDVVIVVLLLRAERYFRRGRASSATRT